MAEIKLIECMYSKDYRNVFEDIANLMFCTELGLEKGVNRRINQRAIESDPVLIDGKWYAYQAKYYDASTKLSAHKQDLITCVKGAASRNATDLFLYINKNQPDTNPDTGEEAEYIREIEDVARRHSVILHWYTLSMIEASLDMPKYVHIKNLYFGHGNIKGYYDYVVERYESPNTGNTLLGEESLAELYMQPSYYKSESEIGDVEQLLDEFISKGNHGVLWIVGEPGHGKTSMCIKAVADYRSKKRYQQARGVFWFRLNPQGTTGMVNPKTLVLEKVLSWGRITGNRSNMIEPSEIEGSLIFLDGFDELKSSLEEHDISINQFYEQVNQLAREYQMHIVVTSRTRALEQSGSFTEHQLRRGNFEITCNLSDGGVLKNNVMLLSPLTEKKQIVFINELISLRESKGIDTSALCNYKHTLQALQEDDDIAGLLKVPILLRMIIQNCFEPSSDNRVELYSELFDKTLLRQDLRDQRERLHSIYREIAFRIFVFDDDCAEINKADFIEITDSDAFLYQYYLHTPEMGSGQGKADMYRLTFLHRSFYQYFLSEFFYEKLKSVTDVQSGETFLKHLWPRHMDPYVLDNLRLRLKSEDINYMQVFKALDETDAFLSEYKNSSGSKESIGNYDKANNVFWNSISICNSIFQVEASQKKMELTGRVIELLSKYTCSGILLRYSILNNTYLRRADLSKADLREVSLREADLREVDLSRAKLSKADLSKANLSEANLRNANLSRADLREVGLREADLREVDLSGAKLSNADLSKANLSGAGLREADLSGANLSMSDLNKANLNNVILSGAKLSKADLSKANLIEADLSKANLSNAKLYRANLSETYLGGAILSGADLSSVQLPVANLNDADLSGADLSGVDLSRAVLRKACLSKADLREANLSGADLSGANLSGADLSGADLSGADLSGANLIEANLIMANLSRANLSGTSLIEANLRGANLIEVDLSNANLRKVDLSEAYLRRANLSNAQLSVANLNNAILSEAYLRGADLTGANLNGAIWGGATPPEKKS